MAGSMHEMAGIACMHGSVLAAHFRAAAGTQLGNQTDVSMFGMTCMSVLGPGVKGATAHMNADVAWQAIQQGN